MIETLGMIGTFLLAVCAMPAAYKAWRDRYINISWLFLFLWGGGEVFLSVYFVMTGQHIIAINCYVNLICVSVMAAFNCREI